MSSLTTRARSDRGSALVEFAMVSPVLLLLIAGVLNYGLALRTATAVANAARVGAQYGSQSPTAAADTAGIQAAALNSAPGIAGMTINSSHTCQCSGGGAVSCTGTCATGNMSMYVQVTAHATAPSLFGYRGLGFTGTTSSQASIRVQ